MITSTLLPELLNLLEVIKQQEADLRNAVIKYVSKSIGFTEIAFTSGTM